MVIRPNDIKIKWVLDLMGIGLYRYYTKWLLDYIGIILSGYWTKWVLGGLNGFWT